MFSSDSKFVKAIIYGINHLNITGKLPNGNLAVFRVLMCVLGRVVDKYIRRVSERLTVSNRICN